MAGYRLRNKGTRCDAVVRCVSNKMIATMRKQIRMLDLRSGQHYMTNSLHFSEWRNCIRAQLKVDLCAPGAPKGPKVGMSVR